MLFLYSKSNCPACNQLENLLKVKSKSPYKVLKLDTDYTRESLQAMFDIQGLVMPRSFPMLFNENYFIGGLNESKLAVVKGEI